MQELVKCRYKKHAFHSADNWNESYPKEGFIDRKNHRLYDANRNEIEYGVYIPIFELNGKKVDYELFGKDDDIREFDSILDKIESTVGLDKLLVIHVNDSKNEIGAHKDRHENIGYGEIGFDSLNAVVHNPRIANVPKILETPYVEDKPPYKEEIEMLQKGEFNNWRK